MPVLRRALAAMLLAACGSSRPADSTSAADREQPPDAGVSLGRPSEPPGDGGVPDLPAKVVRHGELEAQRLSGDPQIEPDESDRVQMATAGKWNVMGVVKYCLDTSGHVSSVRMLRSTGLPRYDEKIQSVVKTWTYQPVVVEGQPADVCTVTTFIYRRPATPPPAAPP